MINRKIGNFPLKLWLQSINRDMRQTLYRHVLTVIKVFITVERLFMSGITVGTRRHILSGEGRIIRKVKRYEMKNRLLYRLSRERERTTIRRSAHRKHSAK
ncbi:hypothetical protein YC2023_116299 [Brassica napus]